MREFVIHRETGVVMFRKAASQYFCGSSADYRYLGLFNSIDDAETAAIELGCKNAHHSGPEERNAAWQSTFREFRAKTGLSQRALAEAIGIPRRTIENWEMGKNIPIPWVQILVLDRMETYARFKV